MAGVDARYALGGLSLRGQFNYGIISNSVQYNEFAVSDLGSAMAGWYMEVAYNLLHSVEHLSTQLIPFIRFEQYNNHASVEARNHPRSFPIIVPILPSAWDGNCARGAMLKADYQIFTNEGSGDSKQQFNMGVAVWF